jgi:hypothetical protein
MSEREHAADFNAAAQRRERVAFSPNALPHHLRPEPRIIIVRPEPDSAFR